VTTAALAVPIILLRKQRAAIANSLRESSAPPRRAGTFSRPLTQISPRTGPGTVSLTKPAAKDSVWSSPISLNAVLYAAKAFGVATLLVAAGSATALWGVKSILGVQDVRIIVSAITIINLCSKYTALDQRVRETNASHPCHQNASLIFTTPSSARFDRD
jgi:hypothetical protein